VLDVRTQPLSGLPVPPEPPTTQLSVIGTGPQNPSTTSTNAAASTSESQIRSGNTVASGSGSFSSTEDIRNDVDEHPQVKEGWKDIDYIIYVVYIFSIRGVAKRCNEFTM